MQSIPTPPEQPTLTGIDADDIARAHSDACVKTALLLRPLFETESQTTERIAAHALFCRAIDHYRGAVLLANHELDAEALALVRGIVETGFVIGALLKGVLSTEELEAFDRAQKGKGARALEDFLQRSEVSEDLRKRVSEYGKAHAGPILKFEALAKRVDQEDMYNGFYRMFSHIASHPSLTAVDKYLHYTEHGTRVRYPGHGRPMKATIRIATTALMRTCAELEVLLGTSPEVNRSIQARLIESESLGPIGIASQTNTV